MAEEDLIFGKNRHMFGGIEPSNMKKFTVSQNVKNNQVVITATLPDDTIIDNQLLCTVGGAVIRRKTTGYPVDEFDGDFVAKITESGTIIDAKAYTNTVYYYAAFPFSTQDVYNRSYTNRYLYNLPAVGYYFGFDIDTTDPTPSTRVTYPSDVMNANFTAAKFNRTTYTFDYGSWPSAAGVAFMPKPCIVDFTTTPYSVTYLNPNDYSKTVDGTSSGIDSTDNKRAMVEWPKIYTHREIVNGIYKFRCSDVPLDEDWDCICNYDINGNQIDHFYTAIYHGLEGRSGKYPKYFYPNVDDFTIDSYLKVVKEHTSVDVDTENLADKLLIQDLLILMAKTTDLSTAYGCWQSSSNTEINGTFDTNGMFYANRAATLVKVFGMEHLWSNGVYSILRGFVMVNGDIKVKFTYSKHDGSSVTNYNETGSGYKTVGSISSSISHGYISDTIVTSYGRIPLSGNGSSTTYECNDITYPVEDEANYAFAGSGYTPGPFSLNTGAALLTNNTIPQYFRLSFKPRRSS